MNQKTLSARTERAAVHAMRAAAPNAIKPVVAMLAMAAAMVQAGTVNYSYDALGRLASAVYSTGSSTTTVTYAYDAAGNRTSVATTTP